MTLITQKMLDEDTAGTIRLRPGHPCKVCGEPLTVPYSYTVTPAGNDVAVHPACGKRWAEEMKAEVEELRRTGKPAPVTPEQLERLKRAAAKVK